MTNKPTNARRERNREYLTPDELQKLLDAVKTPGLNSKISSWPPWVQFRTKLRAKNGHFIHFGAF